jgi:hypothetical protein
MVARRRKVETEVFDVTETTEQGVPADVWQDHCLKAQFVTHRKL